jgi:hypothetical protein
MVSVGRLIHSKVWAALGSGSEGGNFVFMAPTVGSSPALDKVGPMV